MNRIFAFLCICLAIGVIESASDDFSNFSKGKFLASVREYPLFLHKCSATFVRQNVLLSTASCLLCTGKCKLFIKVVSDSLLSPDGVYAVKSTQIHPQYETDPESNDIGIITLARSYRRAFTLLLPSPSLNISDVPSFMYSWRFKDDMKTYRLTKGNVKTISNLLCSSYLNRFVPNTYICALAVDPLSLGPFDLGSPLVRNDKYILGTFTRPGVSDESKIISYSSIFPFLSWLQSAIPGDAHANVKTGTSDFFSD